MLKRVTRVTHYLMNEDIVRKNYGKNKYRCHQNIHILIRLSLDNIKKRL